MWTEILEVNIFTENLMSQNILRFDRGFDPAEDVFSEEVF